MQTNTYTHLYRYFLTYNEVVSKYAYHNGN